MKILLNDELSQKHVRSIQSTPANQDVNLSVEYMSTVSCEERAAAIFSLLLLLEHRDYWNRKDCFLADWADSKTLKWCITAVNENLNIISSETDKKLLCFGSKESSMQFFETFNTLIYAAKDLL